MVMLNLLILFNQILCVCTLQQYEAYQREWRSDK